MLYNRPKIIPRKRMGKNGIIKMGLKPFFSYHGSKYLLANLYKEPTHNIIIEPFAGSAGYSLLYPHKQVKLYDKYSIICAIWDYLIKSKESEILSLPIIELDKSVDDYNICQEAKWLIGFWLAKGLKQPTKKLSGFSKHALSNIDNYKGTKGKRFKSRPIATWSDEQKYRISNQQQYIRHWEIKNQSYETIDNIDATWFIDPPYITAGSQYVSKCNNKSINYNHLANWCKLRKGELIVCENIDAKWLTFEPLKTKTNSKGKIITEYVYYQGFNDLLLF